MEALLASRGEVASQLMDRIQAHAETVASRMEMWHQAFEARRYNDEGITAQRTACDHVVVHLDAQAERLRGEMEALKVRLGHIDCQIGALSHV
jgi:hypothetical protein